MLFDSPSILILLNACVSFMLGEYEDRENAKRPAQLKNRDERKGIMHTNHH